jgi:hypothetical protein
MMTRELKERVGEETKDDWVGGKKDALFWGWRRGARRNRDSGTDRGSEGWRKERGGGEGMSDRASERAK